jgi:hypothetical protein
MGKQQAAFTAHILLLAFACELVIDSNHFTYRFPSLFELNSLNSQPSHLDNKTTFHPSAETSSFGKLLRRIFQNELDTFQRAHSKKKAAA